MALYYRTYGFNSYIHTLIFMMKLHNFKQTLRQVKNLNFQLPDQSYVPKHFHITEVGIITKNFIDCGGTLRKEEVVNFQLWMAQDYDHRLRPDKLLEIITLSEHKLQLQNLEIEVEVQENTISKYGLDFKEGIFFLTAKKTNCLAQDQCGIPVQKPRIRISSLTTNTCTPESGCC